MKAILTVIKSELYHIKNGVVVNGIHENLMGDVSGLRGDVSCISGDVSCITGNVSGLSGHVSGLRGDVSGITGNVSGLSGHVDECEITPDERSKGVNIANLVAK